MTKAPEQTPTPVLAAAQDTPPRHSDARLAAVVYAAYIQDAVRR